MTWAYVAVGAGTLISGYLGSQSANKAGKAAQQGSQQAIDEAGRQFDLVRGDTAGQRFIGNSATNALSRLYGYGPVPSATAGNAGPPTGAGGYVAPAVAAPGGFFNTGAGRVLNPATVSSKLGGAGKILDPAYGLVGNIFGGGGGSHKRNWQAFNSTFPGTAVNADGNYILPEQFGGAVVNQQQLDDLAGTWYGATYAPDGNQAGWQDQFQSVLSSINPQASQGRAGLRSDGVPNMATVRPGGVTIDNATGAVTPGNGTPDMSVFFASPDYQFNLGEGQKAIDRSAAARGGLLSGGAIKEGTRYASGLASREYSNFVDRLMQQAGLGTTGIGASASAGANTAGLVGNAAMTGANAKGSAYLTGANAVNSSVQGGLQNFLLAKYLGG